jgi:glyoxylase-like metal-dependent hydrolase (beta-lactamase superfamily II)/rhodanese-related sulfurtransferase
VEVLAFDTAGLGDRTHVVVLGDTAVVIDPQRDFDRFLAAADERRATVRAVLETHVHNDYVSGAPGLAAATGADLVLPAGAGAAFRFLPAFHQEDLTIGGLVFRPLHTPGHTPEHVSYVLLLADEPVAVFTGGSLLVGAAGRTDLLGAERAESLALLQFGSIRRIAALPDTVALHPTHGPGSFCSVSTAGGAASSIATERASNPLLAIDDAESFARSQLSALQPYPAYYRHIGPINLAGAGPTPEGAVPRLDPATVAGLVERGVTVVDARPRRAVASGRIPGAWAIEMGNRFATWVGWLVPFAAPLVLVMDDLDRVAEARTALARVGFTDVAGVLVGMDGWIAEGRPAITHEVVDVSALAGILTGDDQVIDVRTAEEWEEGHLDGSVHRYLPHLAEELPSGLDRHRPVYVACESGRRAAIAAARLADAGYRPVVVTGGGIPEIAQAAPTAAPPAR